MRRAIWDFSGYLSARLLSLSTANLEDPQCLPCLPLIDLLGNCQTWAEFRTSTPWGDRQRRRIWSSRNPLTQGIPWPTAISSVLERILLCGKHLGTREKPSTLLNSPNIVQTTKQFIKRLCGANSKFSTHLPDYQLTHNVFIVQLLPVLPWTSW